MRRRAADLSPEELARRRDYNRDYMRQQRGSTGLPRGTAGAAKPSEEALYERDRCLAAVLTPGQLLLGDPLPGRSALDRREAKG